jgi:peptide/nickel transport system substrate-binding protein
VKKAVYLWRNESAVRAAMVELGEADLTPDIAVQDAKNPATDYAYFNSETTNLRVGGAWEPPLNDRRVRMALNYAIDRTAIRGSILSKDVIPASQIVVPSTLGSNPEIKVWPYDPQKARQLLDEARKDGVPVDKEIWLVARTELFPASGEVMEALLTMYKAVGFNVKLTTLETSVFVRYRDKPFPTNLGPYILQNQHDNNKGDAGTSLSSRYLCNGRQSVTCDKELDYLIEKGLVSTGETRKKLFQGAFKRIHEEIVPDMMLFHMVGYSRVGKRINFKPSLATTSEIQLSQITFKK